MRTRSVAICVCVLACVGSGALGNPEARKEDLSGCKLPHGELVIPDRNTPEGEVGFILKFSDGTLNPSPLKAEERPRSAGEVLARIAAEKAGDLVYSSRFNGTFVAVSGRASDLGEKFLYELSGIPLQRPQPVQSKKEQSASGEWTSGAIDGIADGHCYLIEAADGKFALVRVVQKRGRLALIQYVYQPDGTRDFAIPKGAIVVEKTNETEARHVDAAQGKVSISAIEMRDYANAVKSHGENREKIVKHSITLISAKGDDVYSRRMAAIVLGQLRAVDAAGVLAEHVNDDLAMVSLRSTVANSYVCAQSLIDIGIPGARAAMSQMEADAKSELPKGKLADVLVWKDRLENRRNLFTLVVLKVYEEKLARIVLEDKMAASDDPKVKEAYRNAIKAFPDIKAWLPDVKQQTTAPAATGPTR